MGLGRVELPTHGLGNRCSIHLSYRPTRVRHSSTRLYAHQFGRAFALVASLLKITNFWASFLIRGFARDA